jgi:hypothetical protein
MTLAVECIGVLSFGEALTRPAYCSLVLCDEECSSRLKALRFEGYVGSSLK